MQTQDKQQENVGDMVANDYRKAEIFRKYGIDFCCGGKKTIDEVCEKKNIDKNTLTDELEELDKDKEEAIEDYNKWPLDKLADHIINKHHTYVNDSLPMLDELSKKVAKVHGEAQPEVKEIAQHYEEVANELRMHMQKEETMLFPFIKDMEKAKRNNESVTPPMFGTVKNPINMMEKEHDSAGGNMEKIRELSSNYTPPEHACNSYKVLYAKLGEFEEDLHQHIHLENNILFPKAIELEEELLK
ncbi:MAG: iron-sulfur cluster repair di-iron protein [Flavobacteriales bacterium]